MRERGCASVFLALFHRRFTEHLKDARCLGGRDRDKSDQRTDPREDGDPHGG